ncbi:DUF3791 domain-containing protein [Enterocloster clostridioformis]|nr:DUF3791 domain-containing protein [Enterocloster clostridioformis]
MTIQTILNTNNRGALAMLNNSKITNTDELEFAVFCIENIAIKLGKNAEEVYQALTEKSDILNSYIVPEYEMLHTQSKDYIVDDIISLMEERGIQL